MVPPLGTGTAVWAGIHSQKESKWSGSHSQKDALSVDSTDSDESVEVVLPKKRRKLSAKLSEQKKKAARTKYFDFDVESKEMSASISVPRATVIEMAYSIGMRFKK